MVVVIVGAAAQRGEAAVGARPAKAAAGAVAGALVVRGGTGARQAAGDGRRVVGDRGGRVGGVVDGRCVQGAEHRRGRAPHQNGFSLPLAMA
jgi:hypothetical protein